MIGNEFSSFVCRIDVLRQRHFQKKQYMYYSIYQYSLQMTTILCYRPSMQFTFNRNLGDQQPRNMDCHKQFHTELQTACRCSSWQSVDHGVFLHRRNVLHTQVSTTIKHRHKHVYLSCVQNTSVKILFFISACICLIVIFNKSPWRQASFSCLFVDGYQSYTILYDILSIKYTFLKDTVV